MLTVLQLQVKKGLLMMNLFYSTMLDMIKGYYKSSWCLLLVFLQFSRIKMIRSQNLKKKCFSIKETDSNVSL